MEVESMPLKRNKMLLTSVRTPFWHQKSQLDDFPEISAPRDISYMTILVQSNQVSI